MKVLVLAIAALLLAAAPASALDRDLTLLRPPGIADPPADLGGVSGDGRVAFFSTAAALSPDDGDTDLDVYASSDGVTTLISDRVQAGPDAAKGASFLASSTDGSVVAFKTDEPLVTADGDSATDVYLRSAGGTTLVSDRVQAGPDAASGATFRSLSTTGGRVLFETSEPLVAADSDAVNDVYASKGGSTLLLSDRAQAGPDAAFGANLAGASDDAGTAIIATSEPLLPADGDAVQDLYAAGPNMATTLLSDRVQAGADESVSALFEDATPDGRSVVFTTAEPLVSDDGDTSATDVYVTRDGTLSLVSDRVQAGPDGTELIGPARVTDDGATVFFTTGEPIVSADDDGTGPDVYRRSGGVTTLMSDRQVAGADAAVGVQFGNLTSDGNVVFATIEPLVPADGDSSLDVYLGGDPAPVLVSDGQEAAADAAVPATFQKTAGTGVLFSTTEKLVAADDDTSRDIYERRDGATTLLSDGVHAGPDPNTDAALVVTADSGRTVLLSTTEPLLPGDGNVTADLYRLVPPPPPPPPPPPDPGTGGSGDPTPSPPAGGGGDAPPPALPAGGADLIAPSLSGLSISPKKVTAGKQATIRVTLSEPAQVTLALSRHEAGRKGTGGKCVKPTRRNRNAKKCTRLIGAGSINVTGKSGANTAKTSKKLKAGVYDIAATAVDTAGNRSAKLSAAFSVVKARRPARR